MVYVCMATQLFAKLMDAWWQRMHAAHHESNEELALGLLPGLFSCCFIAAMLSSARLTPLFRVATQCSGLNRYLIIDSYLAYLSN